MIIPAVIAGVATAVAAVFLLATVVAAGSASTLAVISSSSTVCAINVATHSLNCAAVDVAGGAFTLLPNVSFSAVSGGRETICALRTGGDALICWNATATAGAGFPYKRVYAGATAYSDVTVGDDQVAALAASGVGIQWWRTDGDSGFPANASGRFSSLTSGRGFTCAIAGNISGVGDVKCWGSRGAGIEAGMANKTVTYIVAGDSQICGLDTAGFIVCVAVDGVVPSSLPANSTSFEFKALALGSNHTCAVRRSNGTVLCWAGAGGSIEYYSPVNETSFELVVAGGNLTCGVTTVNLTVLCWTSNLSNSTVIRVPLPRILPGICVSNQSLCSCGLFPDSENLCSGSDVICKQCDEFGAQLVPTLSPPESLSRRTSRGWLAFAIVGSVGGFAGLCSIVFCLWFGICHNKKVHNSVQPTITGNGNSHAVPSSGPIGGVVIASPFISPSGSKSRIFRRQGSQMMRRQRSGPSSFKDRAEEFSFIELAAAAKDFAFECKIGAGSFGTVYKGKLSDGRQVAIKRSESGPRTKKYQEKETAFQSEIEFLSRVHHKHLVGLVGYCEEKDERLLVYEYMSNGALYDHLHSKDKNNSPVFSSWKMRIKVLLDAARGIEYLHNYAVPPIIHRDIKSSNILLDSNWVARVSDFGLSLMGPETEGKHLSIKAAGTVGYMDPEYYGMQHLTVKSDVYGLGVVMLEVLTGKRAIFKEEDGNPMSIVDFAMPRILAGELAKVLDPRVEPPGILEAEAVELVAYMAVHCLSLEGRERPSMNDVVSNLERALELCEESHSNTSSVSLSLASVD